VENNGDVYADVSAMGLSMEHIHFKATPEMSDHEQARTKHDFARYAGRLARGSLQ